MNASKLFALTQRGPRYVLPKTGPLAKVAKITAFAALTAMLVAICVGTLNLFQNGLGGPVPQVYQDIMGGCLIALMIISWIIMFLFGAGTLMAGKKSSSTPPR